MNSIGTSAPGGSIDRVFIFYHYLFPDDVVSAVHMDELCQGLVARGWHVTAFPANRGCRDDGATYAPFSVHKGVSLNRIWRPRFRQSSSAGRLLNAMWMILRWSILALRSNPPEAIVVGTDPILSVAIAIVWKWIRPRTIVVHWAFDLYPEAAYADGILQPNGLIARLLENILRRAYAACDAIIDIGPCMSERLARYGSHGRIQTVVPWALEEPVAVLPVANEERREIFGSRRVAMLYSGSFGRAHTFEGFLALARSLREQDAKIVFSVRGNREKELLAAVQFNQTLESCPVECIPFAPSGRLLDRLAAPDIHLLSLAPRWTGLVVPSKFFGALAAGRPVLYSGSADSSIARWITQYELGWVLSPESVEAVAAEILRYMADPGRVATMNQRCRATYHAHFSRETSIDRMHILLLDLVGSIRQTA